MTYPRIVARGRRSRLRVVGLQKAMRAVLVRRIRDAPSWATGHSRPARPTGPEVTLVVPFHLLFTHLVQVSWVGAAHLTRTPIFMRRIFLQLLIAQCAAR